ncbi:MAG: hypothetical protein E7667_04630 [Ruminococcaceae bacterium]|nr:hypothetical protein [Oscillospiraceae bacterium]
MKKCLTIVLVCLFVLSLSGCNTHQKRKQNSSYSPSENYLIEEQGKQYIILPVSKEKVIVDDHYYKYLDDIDFDMLKEAEIKISKDISQYPDNSGFHLAVIEGYLCLSVEIIVDIELPENTESEVEAGCGIDHEHKFFRERITK